MAFPQSLAVVSDNLKSRFEEPYVSAAINRMGSALPRGVYRGFTVTQMDTPGAGVKISPLAGRDSLLLHEDLVNGFKVAVRFDEAFDFEFEFDASAANLDLYLWVDVSYQVSSAIAGYIRVGESGDLTDDSVPFAKLEIPLGATTILTSYVKQLDSLDNTLEPVPNDAKENYYGLVTQDAWDRFPTQDEKDALDAANAPSGSNPFATEDDTVNKDFAELTNVSVTGLVGVVKFQILGTYYVGTGGAGTAVKWFDLYGTDNFGLVGLGNKRIEVGVVYKTDAVTPLNPSLDAPTGFYTNPYIGLTFYHGAQTAYTGNLIVRCMKQSDYASLPVTAFDPDTYGMRAGVLGWVYESILYNSGRRPATLTVGPYTSSETDYNQYGNTSLIEAVKYLGGSNSRGGIIFVKKGAYIWDDAVALSAPVFIVCEPSNTDGYGVTIDFQHASGWAINATRGFAITDCEMDVSGASADVIKTGGTGRVMICNVDLASGRFEMGSATYDCILFNISAGTGDAAVNITGNPYGVFRKCRWTGAPALAIDDGKDVNVTFDRCEFYGSTDDAQLITTGTAGVEASPRFVDCIAVYRGGGTSSQDPKIDLLLGENARLSVDGLRFSKASSVISATHCPYLRVKMISEHATAILRDIVLEGASPGYYSVLDLPANTSIVELSASDSALDGNRIEVDGISLRYFETGTELNGIGGIGLQAYQPSSFIRLSAAAFDEWDSYPSASSSMACIHAIGGVGGTGCIVIKDPQINMGIPWPSSGTLSIKGIQMTSSDFTGLLQVEGGFIKDCFTGCLVNTSNLDLIVRGVAFLLSNVYDGRSPGALCTVNGDGIKTIMNNLTRDAGSDAGTRGWYIGSTGKCTVVGNTIYMQSSSKDGIYVPDGVTQMSIVGNSGVGQISVKDTDNHRGIGEISGSYQADHDTNSMTTVVLR